MLLDTKQIEVIDDAVAEILKKKTPAERLKIAFGLWDSAKVQISAYLRSIHPDWNDEAINKEAARRLSHGAVRVDETPCPLP